MKRYFLLIISLLLISSVSFAEERNNRKNESSALSTPKSKIIFADEIRKCTNEIIRLEKVIMRIETSCSINRSDSSFPFGKAQKDLKKIHKEITGLKKRAKSFEKASLHIK